jgi:hypothetical protein
MPKKASKKRKIPAETETLDAGDASQTRQKTNPPPEIHEEYNRSNDRHQDDEMQDCEPDGPELTHNSDDTTIEYEYGDLEDCVIQCHEARMAHMKNSIDLIANLCKRVDALVNKTLDECGENQAVSRVIDDLKACMKASIVTHLSFSAHAADFTRPNPDSSQDNWPTTSQAPPEQEKTPATKEPPHSLRRKTEQKATYSPPKKDIKHAAPKSYAELLRGATPENLPKRPAQPLSSKRLSKTNRVFVRLPEDSALRSVHPLFIIKTVNSVLPSGKEVETVSSVRTGVALSPKTGTTTDDLIHCKEKIEKALGGGRVEADEKWVIVKVHDLPTRVTILDDNNSLSSRDVTIEQDILPEIAGAFGAPPETAYWANVREGCPTASVRLAFREEGLKDSPRTVVLMGARLKVEYPVSRGVRPHQCRKCWGLHRTEGCKDAPRCRLCGDPNHRTAEHYGGTMKCVNCNGQHAADSPSCPMTAPAAQKTPRKQKHALKECRRTSPER